MEEMVDSLRTNALRDVSGVHSINAEKRVGSSPTQATNNKK
ncbi:MAG: hypothetical protein ACWA5P_01795 [bacterium]